MKLYFKPGACSLSPHIALREAGLPFELVTVDQKAGKTSLGEDFKAINPKGYTPVLGLDDGRFLTEGPAIVQFIADLAPEKKLAPPAGTFERAQLQQWLNFIATELHKNFSPLFNPKTPPEWKEFVRGVLESRLSWADSELSKRTWLLGDAFSVADPYLYVVLTWTSRVGIELSRWPALAAFKERVEARPAVREALGAEALRR
jgi:glutathione S-transferase